MYLIDTINGKEQLLQRDDTIRFNKDWHKDVLNDVKLFGEKKIVAMTYAKFGALVDEDPDFGFQFEVILCDEIHSLPRFSAFLNNNPNDRPLHSIAKKQLEKIVQRGKVTVIGLSATPKRAMEDLDCITRIITVDADVRRLETMEKIFYTGIDSILPILPQNETGIIYIARVTQMREICEKLNSMGFRAVAIWSKHHTLKMTEEQENARQYITHNAAIPPEYNVLIINASSETSINIYGDVDYMIIHSQEEEPRIQVRGRYREDLKRLYLLDYSAAPIVPNEFMGRKLYTAEKKALCETMKLRNKYGAKLKWTGAKPKLIEAGYAITEAKDSNDHHYAIITY